jgi:hypothetical protein
LVLLAANDLGATSVISKNLIGLVFHERKRSFVFFALGPYGLSIAYVNRISNCKRRKVEMQNGSEKNLERGRLAATKWLPLSAIGAAIPFVIGVIMQMPIEKVLVAAALTSTLVFSGLWMQSHGRERQYRTAA